MLLISFACYSNIVDWCGFQLMKKWVILFDAHIVLKLRRCLDCETCADYESGN